MTENITPWIDLLQQQRWSALGTIDEQACPYVSSVAYSIMALGESSGLLFHLSELALHTQFLQQRPAVSVLVTQPDLGQGNPQVLPRLSLTGTVSKIESDDALYSQAAQNYIQRLPDSEMLFNFGDFHLFNFTPHKGNFVEGFGKASILDQASIASAWSSLT